MSEKRKEKSAAMIQALGNVVAALVGVAGTLFGIRMASRLDGVRAELAAAEAKVATQEKGLTEVYEKLGVCEDGLAGLTSHFNPLAPPPTGWVRYGEKHRGRMENRLFKAVDGDSAKIPETCDVVESVTFASVFGAAPRFELGKGEWFERPIIGVLPAGTQVQVEEVKPIMGGVFGGDTYIAYRLLGGDQGVDDAVRSCKERTDRVAGR